MNDPDAVHLTLDLTRTWLREIGERLGSRDPRDAWAALRVVLHAFRDQLPDNEGAQLAAQLPLLVRGLWYEGYKPNRMRRAVNRADYLDRVQRDLDAIRPLEASTANHAVMAILARHVSPGELRDLHGVLPEELQSVMSPA